MFYEQHLNGKKQLSILGKKLLGEKETFSKSMLNKKGKGELILFIWSSLDWIWVN